jgi:DNA-directed RNA polymerase subunit F
LASVIFSLTDLIKEQDEKRHDIIKSIEKVTETKIVSYYSNFAHPAANIIRQDIIPFNDMLATLNFPDKLDLIVHSPGGIVEVTENIVSVIREHAKQFRVIIPEAAKSAGTLIALASDEIQMSHIAELGPIDPAILVGIDPNTRQPILRQAWSYINSLKRLEEELRGGRDPNIVIPLVHRIDPTLLDVARNALQYSQSLAQNWLQAYMKLSPQKAEEVAKYFSDASLHLTHGRAIRLKEVSELGLKAVKIPDDIWPMIYELHIRSIAALQERRVKFIECESNVVYFEA